MRALCLGVAALCVSAGTVVPSSQDEAPHPGASVREATAEGPSFFTSPLYLEEAPPEVRSLCNLTITHAESRGVTPNAGRTKAEARELAARLRERVLAGEDLVALAREHSGAPNAKAGACLGSFTRGVLQPEVDAFLFENELAAVSEVVEAPSGFTIFERVETLAACRELLVAKDRPDGERHARELLARARAGEDFVELVREHSEDVVTRGRDGALAIFERGPRDALVKAAAFRADVGDVVGPIESSKGWHLLQRVPVPALDPSFREPTLVRARLVLVSHREMPAAEPISDRTVDEAHDLALELFERVSGGEDLAALAAELNDDRGGRARAGDLGWIHRRNPRSERLLDRLFGVEVGHVFEPMAVRAGWVLLERTR